MHTYKCDILPQKHYKKVWYLLKHYKIKVWYHKSITKSRQFYIDI